MRSTVVVVMIAMLVAAPGGVSAQSIAEGSRVRVKTADSRSVGTLTEKTEQQLTLRLENGSEIQVPWRDVERLDVSLGKRRHAGRGFAIGLAAGALGGAALGEDCSGDEFLFCFSRGASGLFLGILGGAAGALVGLGVQTDRWQRVDTGPQITLTLPERGIGAQVNVAW